MKFLPVATTTLSLIASLATNAFAEDFVTIRVEPGSGWDFHLYLPSSVRATQDTVSYKGRVLLYTPFSWQDAQNRGLWINPSLVARGSSHLDTFYEVNVTIYCSERSFYFAASQTTDILHPRETNYSFWAGPRDNVSYYNANRTWPVREAIAGGEAGTEEFLRDSAAGDMAARYCR